jgi:hypothetical protein
MGNILAAVFFSNSLSSIVAAVILQLLVVPALFSMVQQPT